MNKHLLKGITLLLSILALVLCSVPAVSAEEMEEVITGEHALSVRPSDQDSGYVYVNAEVPTGWGGEIRVIFHSRSSGRKYFCPVSYLENEYCSGLWLPEGVYSVSAELPDDDGLCTLELKDSTLTIQKGQDFYLTVLACEKDGPDTFPDMTDSTVIPPMSPDEYEDLPSASSESAPTDATFTLEPAPEEEHRVQTAPVVSLILGILAILLGWVIHLRNKKQ